MAALLSLFAMVMNVARGGGNGTLRVGPRRRLHGPAEALRSFHAQEVAAWVRDRGSTSTGEALAALGEEIAAKKASAGACADPVVAAEGPGCVHQNNGLPCARLKAGCARPCGAFSVKLYGAAGATVREGVLMHLWGSSEAPAGGAGRFAPRNAAARTVQVEGGTFAAAAWRSKALDYAAKGAWFVVVLREPFARVWSRYWYEGRWGPKGTVLDEAAWLARDDCFGGRGLGNRCLSNYYVRTLSARTWGRDAPACDGETEACNGGLPRAALDAAKRFLATAFDDVLVAEWLSHPATSERLAGPLCYEATERAFRRPNRRSKTADALVQPSFLAKRAPGGRSDARPPDWAPDDDAARRVAANNRFDAELYAWAADRELAKLRDTAAARNVGLPEAGVVWRDWELF